jgi:hypothetical protein
VGTISTVTFTLKTNHGTPVILDEPPSVSREDGGYPSSGTTITSDGNGKLTLTVAADEALGYKVLTITAAMNNKPAVAKVTVHTPEEYFTTETLEGIFTITGYTGDAADIVIPGTIGGKTVIAIGDAEAQYNYGSDDVPVSVSLSGSFSNKELTSVSIPDSVSSIGEWAFASNPLISVVIPDSVSSIGSFAFYHNYKLESVVIPNSLTVIQNYTFCYNYKLKSVVIPDSVKTIGNFAFYENQLSSVVIPDSVSSIGLMAFYENQLSSVVIPDSVKTIGLGAFMQNPELSSISIGADMTVALAFDSETNVKNFPVDYYGGNSEAGTYKYDSVTQKWIKQSDVNP